MSINTVIDNFINGNLTEAKKGAKRYDGLKIQRTLIDEYGYSQNKAEKTAGYLKGLVSFQTACDAE
jgi:phage terminase large subunit-like protein